MKDQASSLEGWIVSTRHPEQKGTLKIGAQYSHHWTSKGYNKKLLHIPSFDKKSQRCFYTKTCHLSFLSYSLQLIITSQNQWNSIIQLTSNMQSILMHEVPKRWLYHQSHSQSHPHLILICIHPPLVLPILLDPKFIPLFPQPSFYLTSSFNQSLHHTTFK